MHALPALLLAFASAAADPDPAALSAHVLALAATGDPARLARAVDLVPDGIRTDPAFRGAAAGRVLARLLAAADLRESAAARPDGEADLARARALREAALEELRPLVREAPEDPDVLRTLTVYYGLDGRSEQVARLVEQGPGPDPWLDFAVLAAALRGRAPADAEPLLQRFVAGHPTLLPARMSLVRVRLARGDRDGALAAVDELLAVDPDHGSAQAMKAALLAPPPPRAVQPSVPSAAPPPTAPGWLPRKKATTGGG